MVNEKFVSDLYFPNFQCSSALEAAGDIILGCFWDAFWPYLPQKWSNSMEILTSDTIQSNESDMSRFVFNFKERVKIEQENWLLAAGHII